jgi:hypothetical protein
MNHYNSNLIEQYARDRHAAYLRDAELHRQFRPSSGSRLAVRLAWLAAAAAAAGTALFGVWLLA